MKKQDTVVVSNTAAKERPFDKAAFKKEILEDVKMLFRKTIETASQEEIFQALSLIHI